MNLELFEENGFGKFLLDQRVIPFIKMQALMNHLDEKFTISFYIKFFEEYSQDEEEIGDYTLNKKFTGRELFDYYLYNLGIQQIDVKWINFDNLIRENFKEYGPEWSLSLSNECFSSKSLTIKETEIEPGINVNKEFFRKFIDENKDKDTVDHQVYIPMLMKMFPGMIKVRSLE